MNGAGEKSFVTGRKWPRVLVLGIGEGGLRIAEWMAESMAKSMTAGATVGVVPAALAPDGEALRRSRVATKARLGERVERLLVAGLFAGFEAVILVADLEEQTASEAIVEIARIAIGQQRLTLAAVSLPGYARAHRRQADQVARELAAGLHAFFATDPDAARDSETELRAAVLDAARDVAELLRRTSAEELVQRWRAQGAFRTAKGLKWTSGPRGGATRGPTRGGGFSVEKSDDGGPGFLGGKAEDDAGAEPPFDLSVEEEAGGGPKAPSASVPVAAKDQVSFTVTAPKTVTPGEPFVLKVWAHLDAQLEQVIQRAGADVARETQGAVELERGTEIVVELEIADFAIAHPQARLRWLGSIGNVSFGVSVPSDRRPGGVLGEARIHAAGLHVMTLSFVLNVGKAEPAVAPLPAWEVRFRSAFASYSSKDRDEVLGRIQGMKKIAPDLDVFLDRASLRSGDYWAKRLDEEIRRRDVFFLFWSENAKASKWVDQEWRLALDVRGLDFIDPVPLVPPEQAEPPKELSDKHFFDWELAFRRAPRPAS